MYFRLLMPFLVFVFFTGVTAFGQETTLKGKVTNEETDETLIGVNVVVDKGQGATTNFNGEYSVTLQPGTHDITYKFIGYTKKVKTVTVEEGETKTLNVSLSEKTEELDIVVVSGSKYEKKLSEETVSMEVLQSNQLDNSNSVDAEEAMQKVPGVTITEGQANIRGGSGWSYGAGSRVLTLVNGVPLMTAHAADVKWNFVPMENVKQIEVIKGAASALYGSSALNGVINVRTAWPGNEPYTKIINYVGTYGNPHDDDLKWWDSGMEFTGNDWFEPGEHAYNGHPIFGGTRFVHRRKFNRFDLVVGGNYTGDKGFKKESSTQNVRLNFKTRYRPKKYDGLSFGLNGNFFRSWVENWFVWNGIDTAGYIPLPNSVSDLKTFKARLDPHITYFDQKGNRYSANLRWFNTTNKDNTNQGSVNNKYYGQFSFQRQFDNGLNLVTGASGFYSTVESPEEEAEESLVGEHTGSNAAYYIQADKKFFNRLNLSFGLRVEFFQIDSFNTDAELKFINNVFGSDVTSPVKPVARFGANFQLYEETYLRASFGQGYRFPTITEKFVRTDVGGIGIFPNPRLQSETGWSAEIGVKQGVKVGEWQGYIDVAGFVNQYDDMMEFNFGVFGNSNDPLGGIGFSSQNVGNTRIVGGELTFQGRGEILGAPTTLIAGYTFIEPKSLNWNDSLQLFDKSGNPINSGTTYRETTSSDENFLKYRFRHTLKIDIQTNINKFSIGGGIQFTSFMKNIDRPFVDQFINFEGSPALGDTKAFSGLKQYREERRGTWDKRLNLRAGYQISEVLGTSFIVKNVLNDNITERPGLFAEPRNYTVQFKWEF